MVKNEIVLWYPYSNARWGGRGVDMAGTGCDRVRLQPEIKVTLPTKPFPIESQPNSTQTQLEILGKDPNIRNQVS